MESWQVLLIFWHWTVSRTKGINVVTTLLSLLLFLLVKLSLSLCSRETKVKKGWPAKVRDKTPPILFSRHLSFSPHPPLRLPLYLFSITPVPSVSRQSLTSSWRREPKLPRWRPACRRPLVVSRVQRREPRSARRRRGRTSRCWPCRAAGCQHQVCSITEDELTWPQKHPPPFWNITTLFIFTLQRFIHNLLCKKKKKNKKKTNGDKENILMNLLICLRKGKNELVIWVTSATRVGIPPTISHLFSYLPSLARLGSARVHVAAMPPALCSICLPKKGEE